MAFALPVFRIERLDRVKSTLSESSFSEIFRLAITTSKFTTIAIAQIVRSFSDFMSVACCNIFSNRAAAVATTTETKVVTMHMARKPAGSSSSLWNSRIYTPARTIRTPKAIAQYLMRLNVLTDSKENTLFCPMYPSNLNALYKAMKNATDAAYPYKMNGSR